MSRRAADPFAGRPHVAMAVYADPTHDSRVQREAASLARAGYRVTLLGLEVSDPAAIEPVEGVRVVGALPTASRVVPGTRSPFNPEDPGTSHPVRGGAVGWAAGYSANLWSWGRWAVRTAGAPAVWHAHDFTGLLALAMARPRRAAPLVYDTHELYLELGSAARMPPPVRGVLARIERRLARGAAGVVTVNEGVARELERRYGVRPIVVLNGFEWTDVRRPGRLRAALGLGDRPILLYHGAVSAGRGIEVTVEALRRLPDRVAFVVLGDGSMVPWLLRQREWPELADRIFWHPAVPLSELLSWVVDADLGVALIAPTEMNFVLSTPNKLFECMAAGVPVVVSDFAEMRRIVTGEQIGEVCDPTSPERIADVVATLLEDPPRLAGMRERARDAARRTYNWDAQVAPLVELYRRIAPVPAGADAVHAQSSFSSQASRQNG